jgi:D-glycero-D-manno-heptose 1,7-bisphosphate phosphatase
MTGDVRLYIFDADGTLRRTRVAGQPCPRAPDEWELIPGVAERLRAIRWGAGGALVGVASNQDQVGYGHLTQRMAHRLLMAMVEAATGYRPPEQAVVLCPHRLDVRCACRKPGAAMLERILDFYGLAPAHALFVGDAPADAEAARRAGVRFVWAHDFFATATEDRR